MHGVDGRLLEKFREGRRKVPVAGRGQGCQAKGPGPGCAHGLVGKGFFRGVRTLRILQTEVLQTEVLLAEVFVPPESIPVCLGDAALLKGLVQTVHQGRCLAAGAALHAVVAEGCGQAALKPLAHSGHKGLLVLSFEAGKLKKGPALAAGPVFPFPEIHELAGIGQAFTQRLAARRASGCSGGRSVCLFGRAHANLLVSGPAGTVQDVCTDAGCRKRAPGVPLNGGRWMADGGRRMVQPGRPGENSRGMPRWGTARLRGSGCPPGR